MRKKFLSVFVLIFSTLWFVSSNVHARSLTVKTGFYTIRSSVGDNKVLDISNSSTADGGNLQLWESNRTTAQVFYISPTPDGYYEILAVCSQKALDVPDSRAYVGANIWQYTSNGTDAQKWYFENSVNGTIKIKSKLGGYALDVCGCGTDSGTNVQIWEDNSTCAQQFKLEPIDIERKELIGYNYNYVTRLEKSKDYLASSFKSLGSKNILVLGDQDFNKKLSEAFNDQKDFNVCFLDSVKNVQSIKNKKYDLIVTQKYNPQYLKILLKNQKIKSFREIYRPILYQMTIDYLNENNIPLYFFDAPDKDRIKNLHEIDRATLFEYAPPQCKFSENRWFIERAYGNNEESKRLILSGEVFQNQIIKVQNHLALADMKGKYCNIVDHHRVKPNAPSKYKNTIYLYGPCTMRSKYVADNYTIEKYMQDNINRDFPNTYNVVGYGVEGDEINDFEYILDTKFKPGDIVIEERQFSDTLSEIIDKNYVYRGSLSKALDSPNVGNFALDEATHLNHNGCRAVGNYMYNCIKNKIKELSHKKLEDKVIEFAEDEEDNFIKENPDFVTYLDGLKSLAEPYKKENKKIGSLNVNCNPFTRGHRYLIEQALKRVDHLFLFVVEEDASEFSFKDRYEMVRRGIADLDNITLLKTGKWMCSKFTFPDYFSKDSLQDKVILNPTKDIDLYGKYIAPAIGATMRFAGEEPLDLITRQHNNFMKNKLPDYGIEFCEIPRKTLDDGQVISASKVRKYLKEKNFEELEKLTPKTTYDYLVEHFT